MKLCIISIIVTINKKYMDIQQEINFQLKEAFEKQGIEFAYPTQTVFLANENKK